jgi:hypothetical protein
VKRCLAKIDELCGNSPTTPTPTLYFLIALMQAIKTSVLSSYNYVYLERNALGSVRWGFRGPNTLGLTAAKSSKATFDTFSRKFVI